MSDTAAHLLPESAFECGAEDDTDFVASVRHLAIQLVAVNRPARVRLVKVDNWFGDRWLGFKGKVLGALGLANREELVVPPFVPSRVRNEASLVRGPDGTYAAADLDAPLHLEQTSEANLRRLVARVAPDSLILWWSGATTSNGRGSIMAYVPCEDGISGFHAELIRRDGWTLGAVRGEARNVVEQWIA